METSSNHGEPVRTFVFSTDWTHRVNALIAPDHAVFPVVHTPYDCY